MNKRESVFVVIEGIDRSGKSTLIKELEQSLRALNIITKVARYPNRNNLTGRLLNQTLKGKESLTKEAVHLLFSANRWEDVKEIEEFLNTKESTPKVLLCDRYVLSGVSYSIANGLSEEFAFSSDKGIPQPNLTIFLDISPEETENRPGFGNEIYENKELQYKVYQTMKKNLSKYPSVTLQSQSKQSMHDQALSSILRLVSVSTKY